MIRNINYRSIDQIFNYYKIIHIWYDIYRRIYSTEKLKLHIKRGILIKMIERSIVQTVRFVIGNVIPDEQINL